MSENEKNGKYSWDTCPVPIKDLVLKILDNFRNILGDNLTGFYLHGSLAMGCFNPGRSDIDSLAVVSEPVPAEVKQTLIDFILSITGEFPPKGIEMSIFLEKYLDSFEYPTPFELHFSKDWEERYRDGKVDFTVQQTDEDLAAHLMVTRKCGVCLYGKPAIEDFPEIPPEYYTRSLLSDARWILERNTDDSVYTVLNLCRILAYMKEGIVTSKKEGGQWGMDNLPDRYTHLISRSMGVYEGTVSEEDLDTAPLAGFLQYMKRELKLD